MQYRHVKNLDLKVSTFGIGCMRLPLEKQPDGSVDSKNIDEKEATAMIRRGIDGGVNYIDTAYPYHGGESEKLVAKALKDGYRDKVYLATKLPVWEANSYEDLDRLLDEQLEKLETDCIDFYLLHALNQERWDFLQKVNFAKFLDQAKKDGKIRYAAFSYHDQLPLFKEIIDAYDWDMTQIQLNLLDTEFQAGLEGLRYAAKKGIMTVIMEPLRGGDLAQKIPKDVQAVWDEADTKRSAAHWCFAWLADMEEVDVILSGVSTMQQLEENLEIFDHLKPQSLQAADQATLEKVQALYKDKVQVPCTRCNYCMPCPFGVDIPGVFRIYNEMNLFAGEAEYKDDYRKMIDEKEDASQCTECGQCEKACPQNIKIIRDLAMAHEALT